MREKYFSLLLPDAVKKFAINRPWLIAVMHHNDSIYMNFVKQWIYSFNCIFNTRKYKLYANLRSTALNFNRITSSHRRRTIPVAFMIGELYVFAYVWYVLHTMRLKVRASERKLERGNRIMMFRAGEYIRDYM